MEGNYVHYWAPKILFHLASDFSSLENEPSFLLLKKQIQLYLSMKELQSCLWEGYLGHKPVEEGALKRKKFNWLLFFPWCLPLVSSLTGFLYCKHNLRVTFWCLTRLAIFIEAKLLNVLLYFIVDQVKKLKLPKYLLLFTCLFFFPMVEMGLQLHRPKETWKQ